MTLQEAVQKRVKRTGSIRATARETRVHYSYLRCLYRGEKKRPSKETLFRLGIVEHKEYIVI